MFNPKVSKLHLFSLYKFKYKITGINLVKTRTRWTIFCSIYALSTMKHSSQSLKVFYSKQQAIR